MPRLKLTAAQVRLIAARMHARFWRAVRINRRLPVPPFDSLDQAEQRHWCVAVREYLGETIAAGFDIRPAPAQAAAARSRDTPRRARAPPRP